jgi:hypothetical protein
MLSEEHRRTQRRIFSLTVAVAASMMSAGCSGGADAPAASTSTAPISAPSASPKSPSAADDRAAVETAYRDFWSRLDQAPTQQESQWRASLNEVAVDPQLATIIQAITYQSAIGVTAYGTEAAHVMSVELSGSQATLKDCQDASHSGQADAKTGKPKTVGVPKNPITATLIRTDGSWKVSLITYPGGSC